MVIRTLLFLIIAAVSQEFWLFASENFSVITKDGFFLTADFTPPQKGKTTWVLLHGLDSSRQEYRDLYQELVRAGYGVLAYDARGHGESQMVNNQKKNWRSFSAPGPKSEWPKMIGDLQLVVKKLRQQKGVGKIGLIGASLGANISLNYAADDPQILACALLSPGLNYWGIEILEPWRKYGNRPVLLAASPGDTFATETIKFLAITQPKKEKVFLLLGKNAEHGQQMLHDDFLKKFLQWLRETDQK